MVLRSIKGSKKKIKIIKDRKGASDEHDPTSQKAGQKRILKHKSFVAALHIAFEVWNTLQCPLTREVM